MRACEVAGIEFIEENDDHVGFANIAKHNLDNARLFYPSCKSVFRPAPGHASRASDILHALSQRLGFSNSVRYLTALSAQGARLLDRL